MYQVITPPLQEFWPLHSYDLNFKKTSEKILLNGLSNMYCCSVMCLYWELHKNKTQHNNNFCYVSLAKQTSIIYLQLVLIPRNLPRENIQWNMFFWNLINMSKVCLCFSDMFWLAFSKNRCTVIYRMLGFIATFLYIFWSYPSPIPPFLFLPPAKPFSFL